MPFAHPRKNIAEFGLKDGDRVADLGAGPGHYAIEAGKVVGEDGRVFAVEIQKELVSKVESRAQDANLSNVNVIWGDLEKPEGSTLKDESVDAVIASNVLFQIKDKSGFLNEVWRILAPGGRLLLVDWSDSHGGLGPSEELITTESTVRELAAEVGFTPQQVISPGGHHYGIIFIKPNYV